MEEKTITTSRANTKAGRSGKIRLSVVSLRDAIVSSNEKQLVTAAQAGCSDSFAELVSRHGPGLLEFLRYRTAGVEDAEDLVQETFVRAYLKLDQFSGQWRFSTWLYTIARRLAISHYRKRRFSPLVSEFESNEPGPQKHLMQREMSANLWSIARSLPVNQYEALWLKYAEGMSIKQISRIMNKSQVYVKVLLYRGRVAMGKRLKRMDEDDSSGHMDAKKSNYHINESVGV